MSAWLRNVGNFLEKLDDTAAVAVHARNNDEEDEDEYTRNVLAAHGVVLDEVANLEDAIDTTMGSNQHSSHEGTVAPEDSLPNDSSTLSPDDINDTSQVPDQPLTEVSSSSNENTQEENPASTDEDLGTVTDALNPLLTSPHPTSHATLETPLFRTPAQIPVDPMSNHVDNAISDTATVEPVPFGLESTSPSDMDREQWREERKALYQTLQSLQTQLGTTPAMVDHDKQWREERKALYQTLQSLQTQLGTIQAEHKVVLGALTKEARSVRRQCTEAQHQLTAAETELNAQRLELDQAAQRLDRDRATHKQQLHAASTQHAAHVTQLQQTHADALATAQHDASTKYDALATQLQSVQRQRHQEGGDWHKELDDAVQREAQTRHELALVRDENATLLSHIATLQSNQDALGRRLESLSTSADAAAAREHDAERRLDEALDVQAKQLSQRQCREAELERTVAELSAALVSHPPHETTAGTAVYPEQRSDAPPHDDSLLVAELETVRLQLEQERQRRESLTREMQDVARERSTEERATHHRQLEHDRHVADLTRQVTELRAMTTARTDTEPTNGKDHATAAAAARVQSLSDEVMRLRDRSSANHSEIAALRARLQDALNRATIAEAAAESLQSYKSDHGSDWKDDTDEDVERGARGSVTALRRSRPKTTPTMRAALSIDSLPGGDGRQRIGKSLDTIDKFLSESGKILRYNPMARLLFVIYLLVLHLWTLALLVFHAHGFETVHGDFGSPVGPGALMQQMPP